MIPDDSGPIVDGPGKDQPDEFGFKEKTLNFFFGKRREVWPFIAYKEQIYDFSRNPSPGNMFWHEPRKRRKNPMWGILAVDSSTFWTCHTMVRMEGTHLA